MSGTTMAWPDSMTCWIKSWQASRYSCWLWPPGSPTASLMLAVPCFAVEDGDGAALHAQPVGHFQQHRPDDFAQFQAAFQRVGNVEQQTQFVHDPAAARLPPGCFFARQCPDIRADIHPTTFSRVHSRKACAKKRCRHWALKIESAATSRHCLLPQLEQGLLTSGPRLRKRQNLTGTANRLLARLVLFCPSRPKFDSRQFPFGCVQPLAEISTASRRRDEMFSGRGAPPDIWAGSVIRDETDPATPA